MTSSPKTTQAIEAKLNRAADATTEIYEDYLSANIHVVESLASEARIGRHAKTVLFNDCPFLTVINIPEGVVSVDLSFCTKLEEIDLPSTCKLFVFDGCTSLKHINVPNGLPEGALGSVRNCRSLVELDPILIDVITSFGGCPLLEGLPTRLPSVSNKRSVGAYSHIPSITEMNIDIIDWGDVVVRKGSPIENDVSEFFPIKPTDTFLRDADTYSAKVAPDLFNSCISLKSVYVERPEEIPADIRAEIGHRAFKSCVDLSSVDLGYRLADIDSQAFEGCTNLTNIATEVPLTPGITVGHRAFACCINYDPATIIANTAQIGPEAFSYCVSLEVADLSNMWPEDFDNSKKLMSLRNYPNPIANGAFEHCISLKTVNFNDRIAHIGKRAFYHCTEISSINIPAFSGSENSSVTIAAEAFKYCISLRDFSSETQSIGHRVFEGCQSLGTVNLVVKGAIEIGEYAFSRAIKLTEVIADTESVQLSAGTFNNCYSLNSIKGKSDIIPTIQLGDSCFKNCVSLNVVEEHESVEAAFSRCVSLTATNTVDGLAPKVYKDCNSLESVNIAITPVEAPEDEKASEPIELNNEEQGDGETPEEPEVILTPVTIGESALEMCSSLHGLLEESDVYLVPEGLAFSGCVSLESLPKVQYNPMFIPESPEPEELESLEKYSNIFDGCYKLKELNLEIGPGLYTIETPEGDKDVKFPMHSETFDGCYSLTSLRTEGDGILVVDDGMSNLSLIESLDIPNFEITEDAEEEPDYPKLDSVIEDLALLKSSSYTNVDNHYMFNTVENLSERSSFKNCFGLTGSADIDCQYIKPGSFSGCRGIDKVVLSGTGELKESVFEGCNNLKEVALAEGELKSHINTVAVDAEVTVTPPTKEGGDFSVNVALVYETRPTSFYSVSKNAFKDCISLRKVRIPDCVSSIDPEAFVGCTALTEITIERQVDVGSIALAEGFTAPPDRLEGAPWGYPCTEEEAKGIELDPDTYLYGNLLVKYVYIPEDDKDND